LISNPGEESIRRDVSTDCLASLWAAAIMIVPNRIRNNA
jgi:hypothetical protein